MFNQESKEPDLLGSREFDCEEFAKAECMMIMYLLKLNGLSSREIADTDRKLPSHSVIAQEIKQGKYLFERWLPIFMKILAKTQENGGNEENV